MRMTEQQRVSRGSVFPRLRALPFAAKRPSAYSFKDWTAAMVSGDFDQAWRINDATGEHWPSAHQLWSERLRPGKRVVLRALHGLGDAVQMMPYAAILRARGVDVSFQVPGIFEPLLPFFNAIASPAICSNPRENAIEIMELPYLCRTRAQDLPLAENYLRLPRAMTEAVKTGLGAADAFRVGLVWRGGDWDRSRWMPLSCLDAFSDLQGVEFWNLQAEENSGETSRLRLNFGRAVGGSGLVALAAMIANMDVMVTVDTLAAHLAGALGVRTLLLLKYDADWRWLTGSQSLWYPSVQLLRQPSPGDWGSVAEEARGILAVRKGSTAGATRCASLLCTPA